MTTTVRLTMSQALVRYLMAQRCEGGEPLFAGMWAIFGHGNVAGLGEALWHVREAFPTYRAHNEQAMAHAAIAFAKTMNRRRMMACTTSIGPGATNMVTAAALAHVNRLPVLLLPGDVFASRRPDPVLQQIEHFADVTVSANDCFRPVSRHFDRISRPEQILDALPKAMAVLTDPAACGPTTLALCQDTQVEAFDYPLAFFAPRIWRQRRPAPDAMELADAAALLGQAQRPMIIAGGGVHYSQATATLRTFAERHGIPVCETQAGKSALPHDHALNLGAIGVTGTAAANAIARDADVILAVGTRLQDFTTGSRSLFEQARLVGLNTQPYDAAKHAALPLIADARVGLEALSAALGAHATSPAWRQRVAVHIDGWRQTARAAMQPPSVTPTDASVLGAVARSMTPDTIVVCAAGGLPGELHKLWPASEPGSYHLEYGYSCMGYEIAGALGVKLARPDRSVVALVGDGSYLMMNSEIATSVLLGLKLTIVVLDNGGFGCIDRLQRSTGQAGFNNLIADTRHVTRPLVDFAAHAASLGAIAERVADIAALEAAIRRAEQAERTSVIVIGTDPRAATQAGGTWWDVAVPEVSARADVRAARSAYDAARRRP